MLIRTLLTCLLYYTAAAGAERPLRIATFDIDVTPPVGSMMAYDPVKRVDELGLRARGIVVLGAGEPIVLCAMDWIGIGNDAHDSFRRSLASIVKTSPERVAVHTLHQHDAPSADFSAERLLRESGARNLGPHDGTFAREALQRLNAAVLASLPESQPVTHVGFGRAEVKGVASNRRLLGSDGRVRATRFAATTDAALRAEPEGVIDPLVSVVSFWNETAPIAVLSYFACHPQSYYRMSVPSPDFPGIARFIRGQEVTEALHVHFNGAGGNIAAGKYNDGARENRMILASRLADGMKRAFEGTQKYPLAAKDVGWEVTPVALPVAKHLNEATLRTQLAQSDETSISIADDLAWYLRQTSGSTIDLTCLRLASVRILHLPGELFVEYQLAARSMRPSLDIVMAAYGDYGPGYIGTARAYQEGGFETKPGVSHVAPESEAVLLAGIRTLLED